MHLVYCVFVVALEIHEFMGVLIQGGVASVQPSTLIGMSVWSCHEDWVWWGGQHLLAFPCSLDLFHWHPITMAHYNSLVWWLRQLHPCCPALQLSLPTTRSAGDGQVITVTSAGSTP
jgi:hypothetical protein